MCGRKICLIFLFFSNVIRSELGVAEKTWIKPKLLHGNGTNLYEYNFMAVIVKHVRGKRNLYRHGKLEAEESGENAMLLCGGAIVHKDWVITSARCFEHLDTDFVYEVYAGIIDLDNVEGQQVRAINRTVIHSKFNPSSDEYSIAMIEVTPPFMITKYVNMGHLPTTPLQISGTESCHILGFVREYRGKDDKGYSERLMKVQLHAVDYKECADRLTILNDETSFKIMQKNYCLVQERPFDNTQGACEGDVGGPCICSFKIQGVIASYTNKTCFKQGYPTSIIDIGHHLNWVRSNVLQLNLVAKSLGSVPYTFLITTYCLQAYILRFI